jgi:hypothetical protein
MAKEKVVVEGKGLGSFTNSNGDVFTIRGLSPMLPDKITGAIKAEWNAAGKALPVCPTYEVVTISGEKETHFHNETTLVVDGDSELTARNQKEWSDYVRLSNEFEGENSARIMKKVFLSVDTTPTDEWRDEMQFLGIELPLRNTAAEKYLFVETKVVQSASDIAKLMTSVLCLAGVISEASKNEAEATFQRALEDALALASSAETKAGKLERKSVLR